MQNRALFLFPTAVLGGAERVLFNLICYLLDKNFIVTVYIMSRGKKAGWETIENHPNLNLIIKNYNSEKTSLLPLFFNMILLSFKYNFNYLISSHTHTNAFLSFMKKIGLFRKSILVSRESTLIFDRFSGLWRAFFKFKYDYMYGKQNLLICQTERMKTSLIKALGHVPAQKIEVIPNPVNIEYIDYQIKNSTLLGKKPFNKLVVGCGRLIPLKKFDYLIQAFSLIHNKFLDSGLVIIGDGPELNRLQNLVKELGISEKVIFTGKITNPIQWFAIADIGIVCSELEGFPNVLIEMMASQAKKVITTPCTDGVYQIPHIEVLKECSVECIAVSLEKYLDASVDESALARKYIEDFRSVDAFWSKIEELT